MKLTYSAILVATLLVDGGAAHPVGRPAFGYVCQLGQKAVRVTTEGNDLVYRYGTTKTPELTIRGNAANRKVFLRHDTAMRAEVQQLRFVNGAYSYVLSSLFVAAAGGEDRVKFSVLHDDKVVRTQLCRGSRSFEDFGGLDGLPRDGMRALVD